MVSCNQADILQTIKHTVTSDPGMYVDIRILDT